MMSPFRRSWLVVALLVAAVAPVARLEARTGAGTALQAGTLLIAEIRIQGNYRTSDDEVIELAGVDVGGRVTPEEIRQVERRLRDSGVFAEVEVRTRFRSLAEGDRIALVILVRERLVPHTVNPLLRPFTRAARQVMFLPVLDYTEGYGFTYGARVSLVDWLGGGERISVPLTWGGTKRAVVELDRTFTGDRVTRVIGGFGVLSRRNPHFEIDDRRVEGWGRVEHEIVRHVIAGGGIRWSDVRFGDVDDAFTGYTADLALDTRTDPTFPRNAVFARAGWEAMDFPGTAPTVNRYRLEGRGYLGLIGQSVLSLRALHERADRPQPSYAQFLLGGGMNLRGYRTGAFAGDRLAAASAELRLPLDSPLGAGRAGVTIFFDVGAIYDVGTSVRKARFRQGAGGGVFLSAPFVHLNLEVGSNLRGGGRVHFSTGFTF